jgi:hypothetical protein
MKRDVANLPHLVYRCYDANDELIYIGCTSLTIEQRMRVHRRSNPPVAERTVRWTTESYPDRESALDAEANAIYRATPPLNYRFNPARSRWAGVVRVEPTQAELADAVASLGSLFKARP